MAPNDRSDKLTKGSALIVALCSSSLFLIFVCFGEPARGRAAWVAAGTISGAMMVFWDLRKFISFWVTAVALILLHIPVVFLIPWTNRNYPGVVILPIALADFGILYGCFKLVEKAEKSMAHEGPP
jgi:hypothetical protein